MDVRKELQTFLLLRGLGLQSSAMLQIQKMLCTFYGACPQYLELSVITINETWLYVGCMGIDLCSLLV